MKRDHLETSARESVGLVLLIHLQTLQKTLHGFLDFLEEGPMKGTSAWLRAMKKWFRIVEPFARCRFLSTPVLLTARIAAPLFTLYRTSGG
jgi:hypothetical protein